MDKGSAGRFFEDFQLGEQLPCPSPRMVGQGERTQYSALTSCRLPRFLDEHGFIHPLTIFGLAVGQASAILGPNLIGDRGWADTRWHRPVILGSTLRTSLKIVGLREEPDRGSGTVWCRVSVRDHDGQAVMTGTRWVQIRKRAAEPTKWLTRQTTPNLKLEFEVNELIFSALSPVPPQSDTGGQWWFEDYFPGETLYQQVGLPTDRGAHGLFCGLLQDRTPRFLDHNRGGVRPRLSPLYALSLAYAVAHSGLENRQGLVALNHLKWVRPVSPGQVLYTLTQVKDTCPVDGAAYGALRCRTFAFTDVLPEQGVIPLHGSEYHPGVVLDLDYWETVTRMPFR